MPLWSQVSLPCPRSSSVALSARWTYWVQAGNPASVYSTSCRRTTRLAWDQSCGGEGEARLEGGEEPGVQKDRADGLGCHSGWR
jgi:hypothetical protein